MCFFNWLKKNGNVDAISVQMMMIYLTDDAFIADLGQEVKSGTA